MIEVELSGPHLYLTGRMSAAENELVQTMPGVKWDRPRACWRCDITPAGVWRLLYEPGCERKARTVEMADELDRVAARFGFAIGCEATREQPPLRKPGISLWGHQAAGFNFANLREGSLLNMWMGTGKSCVAVHLVANRHADKTLVLCPTAVRGVWRREFHKWCPVETEVLVLDKPSWTVKKKAEQAAKFVERCELLGVPCVVVINYEAAWRPEFARFVHKHHWDVIIADESQKLKNPQSNISKFCSRLPAISTFRLCLSGTPLTHSPLDAFGQFRFLDPGVFGTSWARFRDRYAILGPLGSDHVVGYKNQAELADLMGLLTFKAGKEVLTGLPPFSHEYVEGVLCRESLGIYQQLDLELIAEARSGVISTTNALTKLLRLQQISSGFCEVEEVDPDGARTGVKNLVQLGTEKYDMLLELLEGVPQEEPVVVFCRFVEDLARIRRAAEATGRTYGEISGRCRDLTPDGTMPEGITLMGVQIQSGGVGIDLTRACYCVYYSVGHSLGDYLQSLERCHRPGQTRATLFYHLVLAGTLDPVVYKALQRRQEVIEAVLAHIKGESPEPAVATT